LDESRSIERRRSAAPVGHPTQRSRALRTLQTPHAIGALRATGALAGLGLLLLGAVTVASLAFASAARGEDHLPPLGPPPVIRTLIPIASGASEKVSFKAGFSPYELGASTTIEFGFRIQSPPHTVPQPLIGINLSLPAGLGAGTTRLGLSTCNAHTILEEGIEGCPPNSLLGRGVATSTVPIGPAILSEQVKIALLATASRSGHLEILYGAEGVTPVFAQLVFRGEILEGAAPYGEQIDTFIPPIETLPEAPYAAVVSMRSTIGPKNITYYRRAHGRRIAFQPAGIQMPRRCPRGGFKFAGTFTFLDGAAKTIRLAVPCPASDRRSIALHRP
jgi:hypothetical protein